MDEKAAAVATEVELELQQQILSRVKCANPQTLAKIIGDAFGRGGGGSSGGGSGSGGVDGGGDGPQMRETPSLAAVLDSYSTSDVGDFTVCNSSSHPAAAAQMELLSICLAAMPPPAGAYTRPLFSST